MRSLLNHVNIYLICIARNWIIPIYPRYRPTTTYISVKKTQTIFTVKILGKAVRSDNAWPAFFSFFCLCCIVFTRTRCISGVLAWDAARTSEDNAAQPAVDEGTVSDPCSAWCSAPLFVRPHYQSSEVSDSRAACRQVTIMPIVLGVPDLFRVKLGKLVSLENPPFHSRSNLVSTRFYRLWKSGFSGQARPVHSDSTDREISNTTRFLRHLPLKAINTWTCLGQILEIQSVNNCVNHFSSFYVMVQH